MDIRLPDGTLVHNIPDDMSRDEFITKAKANGMDIPEDWTKPKTEVGFAESAGRTMGQATMPAVKTLGLAAAGLAGMIPGGEQAQEAIFKQLGETEQSMGDVYAPKEGEHFNPAGEFAGGLASAPVAVAGQGVAPGIQRASEVVERGGDVRQAAEAGLVTGVVNQVLQAASLGGGSKLAAAVGGDLTRKVTAAVLAGGAANTVLGIGGQAIQNAAVPEGEQFKELKVDPLDVKRMTTDFATGGLFGMHGGLKAAKGLEAKAAAEVPFPADKFKDLGDGDHRAPNGAIVTEEAWADASDKTRARWMKEQPAKTAANEAPITAEAELDHIKALHPSEKVAEIVDGIAEGQQTARKNKVDAEGLRRAAEDAKMNPDLKQALLMEADKLDPPAEKTAPKTAEEVPAEKVATTEGEKQPLPSEGAKESYTEQPAKGTENAVNEIPKQEGIQPERVQGNESGKTAEAGLSDRVQHATEGEKPVGETQKGESKTATPNDERGQHVLTEGTSKDVPTLLHEDFFREQQSKQQEVTAKTAAAAEGRKGAPGIVAEGRTPEGRGLPHVRRMIDSAAKGGHITEDGAALLHWFLDKNPNAASRLGIMLHPPKKGALGEYDYAPRIIDLFKSNDPKTAIHELFHHLERMLPDDVRQGIRREWRKHLDFEMKKASPEVRAELQHAKAMANGDPAALDRLMGAFNRVKDANGKTIREAILNKKDHYQLVDPSEFWAVNAARLMNEKFTGRGSWRAKVKQWMQGLLEHVKDQIGLRSDHVMLKALKDTMNPDKTKGNFVEGARPLKLEEITANQKRPATNEKVKSLDVPAEEPKKAKPGTLPEEGRQEKNARRFFDSLQRITTAQNAAGITGEKADIRLAARLMLGKVKDRVDTLTKNYSDPIGDLLGKPAKKLGLTVHDADDYVTAVHALERNPEIDKINPKAKGGGSGMTDAQAAETIASYSPEQKAHLDKISALVRKLNDEKLNRMVEDGLITSEARDSFNAKYKNYVPLKTLDKEADFTGLGRGFKMWDNDIKQAFGRTTRAGSPIAASIMDATRAIARGERARVNKAVWEFSKDEKGSEFIKPYDENKPPPEVMGREKGADGKVKEVVDRKKLDEYVVPLVVDGEPQRVFIRDPLLKEAIATAGSPEQVHSMLKAVSTGTRTVSRLFTEWNFAFAPINQIRDIGTALIRAKRLGISGLDFTPEKIIKSQADVVAGMMGKDTEGARLYKEMKEAGGQTGGYGLTSLEDVLHNMEKSGAKLGYEDMEKGAAARQVKNAAKAVGNALSHWNEVFEYSTRLAAYKAAKAKGMTPARAAEVARKITVDFNVSGEVGRNLGHVYSFANASLQGLAGDIHDLKSPKTRYQMMSLIALGGAVRMYNELYGGTNEDTGDKNIDSQYENVTDNNIVLLKPGTRTGVKIPLPPGAPTGLFTLGNRLAKLASQKPGEKEYEHEMTGILSAAVQAVMPVRMSEGASQVTNVLQGLVPTAGRGFADVALNSNQFGQQVTPEQHSKTSPVPAYTLSRKNTSAVAKAMSEFMNTATGGDSVTPGASQRYLGNFVSPEAIEYLATYYGGGAGQSAMQLKNIAKNAVEGKPQDISKIPVARRLVATEPETYIPKRYGELTKDFEYAKRYRKTDQEDKISPRVANLEGEYEESEKKISALRKEIREAGASGEDTEPLYAQVKKVQSEFIKAYNAGASK